MKTIKKILKVLGLGVAALGGIAILLLIGLVAYFIIAAPESPIVDDSDLRIDEPPIPDEENAYLAFIAATNHFDFSSKDQMCCWKYIENNRGEFAERSEIDRIVKEHEAAFLAIERIGRMNAYRLVPTSNCFGAYFPPISSMMRMNNLCRVKALRSFEEGDYDTAFGITCDSQKFFSLCTENASTLVEFLAGIGTSAKACKMFVALANADGVSDEMLEKIANRLETEFDEASLFERTYKCEYQNYGAKFLDDIELIRSLSKELRFLPVRFAFSPGMTRLLIVNAIRDELSGIRSQVNIPDKVNYLQPNWAGYFALRALMPSFDAFRDAFKKYRLATRTARTAVAVIRYARAHDGQGPQALSELVPTYLNEVPRDPFDQERELGYDREKGIVWSVGKDGDFDPFAEKVIYLSSFNRNMADYARRIDGKPIEMRKPPNRKIKKTN